MLILGIEPSLIAYKTIVRTDTLYELKYKSTSAGLEPTRQFANRFQICLLNHSDRMPFVLQVSFFQESNLRPLIKEDERSTY